MNRALHAAPSPPRDAARLRRRDEPAFEHLVRTHGGRLLQVARRYLVEEDARDAVQEAFLSAYKAIDRFDGKSQIGTWLHRILVNSCLMRLRKPSVRREESIEVKDVPTGSGV